MVKVTAFLKEKIRVACDAEKYENVVETDVSAMYGGYGQNMGPTELVAAGLGACILVMMGLKAKQLGVDLTGSTAEVDKELVSDPHLRIGSLKVVIKVPIQCEADVVAQLEKAARECPVHRSLAADVEQEMVFEWGRA